MPGFDVVPSDLRSSFRQPIRAVPMVLGKRDSCRGSCSRESLTTFEIRTSTPLIHCALADHREPRWLQLFDRRCFDKPVLQLLRSAHSRQSCLQASPPSTSLLLPFYRDQLYEMPLSRMLCQVQSELLHSTQVDGRQSCPLFLVSPCFDCWRYPDS